MNRRSALKSLVVAAALATGVVAPAPVASAQPKMRFRAPLRRWVNRHRRYLHHHLPRRRSVRVWVRPGVRRWVNRHRRYLHHHLPRRRFR